MKPSNPLDLVRSLFSEWEKTSQPLKERMSVLPFGQYEDGSVGLAWPGMVAAPFEGVANFGRYGYDTPEAIRDNAASAFDVAGGAVTGGLGLGLAGGLADNALGSAGGKLTQSKGVRAYHGGQTKDYRTGQEYTELNSQNGPWSAFFSDDPNVANRFAGSYSDGAGVFPVDIRLQNPRVIDAQGRPASEFQFDKNKGWNWNAQDRKTGEISRDAQGFSELFPYTDEFRAAITDPSADGVILKNTKDEGNVYIPTKRGTVYSATTGKKLYANAPTGSSVPLAVNALERAQPQGIRAYRGVRDVSQRANEYYPPEAADELAWWGSSSPDVANHYTKAADNSAVIPAEVRFQNPMEFDLQGGHAGNVRYNGRQYVTEEMIPIARRLGHDGLVFKNVRDAGRPQDVPVADTFAALQPGTVYSATTGDLLYANAPTGASVPLAMEDGEEIDLTALIAEILARASR